MANNRGKFLEDCDVQMQHLANRGAFSSLSRQSMNKYCERYTFKWHLGRRFELEAHAKTQKLTFPCILPQVDKKSVIDRDLRGFVKSMIGPKVAKHRRLADNSSSVRLINRQGMMSLSIAAEDGDFSALVDRTIGLGHQIFTLFLRRGGYDEYLVEVFDIDLDTYM
jgi:hypothetical protein